MGECGKEGVKNLVLSTDLLITEIYH